MQKIDFNSNVFKGFEDGEDILLDTGVILSFLNPNSVWHKTVYELFDRHIFGNDNSLFLYINPTLVDEFTHVADKPAKDYAKATGINIDDTALKAIRNKMISDLKSLIDDNILLVLEGNKSSILKQLSIYESLGSADAVHASIANEYGISFLTVDNKLVNNMFSISQELENIHNVYYTNPSHRTY